MQKLLTIVVPVYKVEPYINKCLDSCVLDDEKLMNQLEVIIVNDGTPDRSAEMSREYVKRYPQTFRQIDKENGGHGSAWNVGLKEATGKYLRFLDSDDWLTNLDMLMEKLAETDADLVFTNECVWNNEELIRTEKCCKEYDIPQSIRNNINLNDFFNDIKTIGFRKCTYKTCIFESLQPLFREHVCYDDTILYVAPLLNADSYIAFDFVVYNLLRGREEQSMNLAVIRKNAQQILLSYNDLYKFIEEHDFGFAVIPAIYEIENVVFNYCASVFVQLSYAQRKSLLSELFKNPPRCPRYSKSTYRYINFPFFIAWFIDELRALKHSYMTHES